MGVSIRLRSLGRTSLIGLVLVVASWAVASCDGDPADPGDEARVQEIIITPGDTALLVGDTLRFRALVHDDQGRTLSVPVRWTSSDTQRVRVDADGLAEAVGAGSARISAAAGRQQASAAVSVYTYTDTTVAQVVVTPEQASLWRGDTLRLEARAYDRAGLELQVRTFVWTSADPAVVSVDSSGHATAHGPGSTRITATLNGISGHSELTVSTATLRILPDSVMLVVGESFALRAQRLGGDTAEITGAAWQSSNTTVAEVDAQGRVTAHALGRTTISTAAHDTSVTAVVRVVEAARSCSERAGTTHSAIDGTQTWRKADNPHRVRSTLQVKGYSSPAITRDTLILGPGVLVCGSAGAALQMAGGVLLSLGTVSDSVVLTSAIPNEPWGGIAVGVGGGPPQATAALDHTRLENAVTGVLVWSHSRAEIRNSHLRLIRGCGARTYPNASVWLRHSVVDTAAMQSCEAALYIGDRSEATLEETTIRGSGADGLFSYRAVLRLFGGRIEGSSGSGLVIDQGGVSEARPMRITGNGGYPMRVPISNVAKLLSGRSAVDSIRGNAKDTVLIFGALDFGETVLRAGIPWKLVEGYTGAEFFVRSGAATGMDRAVLRIEPGVVLHLGHIDVAVIGTARLFAQGTADQPIVLVGGNATVGRGLSFASFNVTPDTSRLSHVRLENIRVLSIQNHPLAIENSSITNGYVYLRSPGSRLTGSVVERSLPHYTAVVLGAAGVSLQRTVVRSASAHGVFIEHPNVSVSQCTVTDNNGDGIHLTRAGDVQVHDCNLERNRELGVRNTDVGVRLDARFNWWGDPAGPTGSNGDGVGGDVDYSHFHTQPVTWGGGSSHR